MAGTVQFDCEFQSRTIEIQDVRIDWMLSPEFVTREIPVSQMAPEDALAICCIFAEITGATHWGDYSTNWYFVRANRQPLTSILSPQGERKIGC